MTDYQLDYSIDEQLIIKQRIQKLFWLQERFGDLAKYQGFDQEMIVMTIMQEVLLLRLQIFANPSEFTDE